MGTSVVTDADAAYLERIAEDCARVLGSGIDLERLELGGDADVVLTLRFRLGAVKRTSEGRGDTVVAAHADLRQRLVLDRIRIGTSALYRRER